MSAPEINTDALVAGWLHWTSSILEGAETCPHWSRYILGVDAPSLLHDASARSTIYGPKNTLFTVMVLSVALLLIKDFHSISSLTAKRMQQWALGHGINWSNHVLHHLEATEQSLKAYWYNVMAYEDSVPVSDGSQHPERMGCYLKGYCKCCEGYCTRLKQRTYMVLSPP